MNREYKITGFADEIDGQLDVQISSLKKLNIKFVEMRGVDGNNLIYHDNAKVNEIKRKLNDAGISLSELGTPLGKIGITDSFDKHFEEFKRAVEIAHMMNTKNIRMFSFYIPGDSVESRAKYRNEVFDRIGRFVDYARGNDVILLHENEKGIYGEKAPECRELMDEFGCECFKAIFDFANFVQADQDTLEAYRLMKDYIAYIHIKDALRGSGKVVPVGYGDGNVKEILDDLFTNGFDGFLSLEPHLFDFSGLAELEKGGNKTVINEQKKLTGFEAFSLAYDSLKKILG
jgi:sugar phosphate isomerase/epimerase